MANVFTQGTPSRQIAPSRRTSSRPPTGEIGAVGNFGSGVMPWQAFIAGQFESVLELIWPTSVTTYSTMFNDSQVYALWLGTTLPIRRYKWLIDPNESDPKIVEGIANDLRLPIKGQDESGYVGRSRDRFSHDRHIYHALLSLGYGHYFFEQVGSIEDDGLWHLSKLAPRPPSTLSMIGVAEDGGLVFIQQAVTRQPEGIAPEIPVDRLVAFVWDMEGANWAGRSMFRSIYKNWLIKDRLLRIDAINHERAGGIPYINAPPGASEKNMEELAEMAQAFRVGEEAGGALPDQAKLNFAAPVGSNAVESIKMHNEEMARAFLMMFMQLGQTQTGSYALGSAMIDYFSLQQQGVAKWYAEIMTQHVIEDWVDWNYGPEVERVPQLCFEPSDDPLTILGPLVQLINAKAITVDPELEAALREGLNLPPASRPQPFPEPTPPEPPPVEASFDPNQKRDRTGRWTDAGNVPPGRYTLPSGRKLEITHVEPRGRMFHVHTTDQKRVPILSLDELRPEIEGPARKLSDYRVGQKVTVKDGGYERKGEIVKIGSKKIHVRYKTSRDIERTKAFDVENILTSRDPRAQRQTCRVTASASSIDAVLLPGRPLRRQPYEQEVRAQVNYASLETDYVTARDRLVSLWKDIRNGQVNELTDIVAQTAPDDLENLASIQIEPGEGTAVIERIMHEVLGLGAAGALKEAQAQGQSVSMPNLKDARKAVSDRAAAVDALLTRDLSAAVSRKAVSLAGEALSADEIAHEVRLYLDGLSDAYLTEQFGGAVQAAQNAGRREVMDKHEPVSIYASELLDTNTCENCRAVDGTQYGTLGEFDSDYPTGGYKDCLGGVRCRGTGVAVYREEAP